MKRISSQIWIGILCVLLGYAITYQIKSYSEFGNLKNTQINNEVAEELKTIKAQRDEFQKKNEELINQIKAYEENGASEDTATKKLYEEVEKSRELLCQTDVVGEGIEITITPQSLNVGGTLPAPLDHLALLNIVNELYFLEAEAVAINDIRITNYTGIRSSSGGRDIFIGREKISPNKEIKITAIGKSEKLFKGISFPGVFDKIPTGSYETPKYEEKSSIAIPKSNEALEFNYATENKK